MSVLSFLKAGKWESSPLAEYSCSHGGDMSGGHSFSGIKAEGDCAVITFTNAAYHNSDSVTEEYSVPLSVLDDIRQIFENQKMHRYPFKPKNKVFALDAGSTCYHFVFENGNSCSFNSDQRLSAKDYEAIGKIRELMKSAAEQGERLPSLVVEDKNGENPDFESDIHIYEYARKVISFRLKNRSVGFASSGAATKIYLADNRENPIYQDNKSGTLGINLGASPDNCVTLPERLAAGRYILTHGDYETEFEIKQVRLTVFTI